MLLLTAEMAAAPVPENQPAACDACILAPDATGMPLPICHPATAHLSEILLEGADEGLDAGGEPEVPPGFAVHFCVTTREIQTRAIKAPQDRDSDRRLTTR
jgi:hypothetical protein